jgi:flagellar basal-body rod modification protein FlgD
MQVNPAAQSTAPNGSASNTTSNISSDFETFLKMLTVQMQNQDPLNPVDSSDYAVQLATFSNVEQQVLTNDLLKSLSGQLASTGMADMAGWVGKEARALAPAYWDGTTSVTLAPNPVATADRTELIVKDQWGTEVSRQDIPATADNFTWNGLDANGTPLPTGTYTFELASYEGEDLLSQDMVELYSTIQEIQSDGTQTVLLLDSGARIPTSSVTAIRGAS